MTHRLKEVSPIRSGMEIHEWKCISWHYHVSWPQPICFANDCHAFFLWKWESLTENKNILIRHIASDHITYLMMLIFCIIFWKRRRYKSHWIKYWTHASSIYVHCVNVRTWFLFSRAWWSVFKLMLKWISVSMCIHGLHLVELYTRFPC